MRLARTLVRRGRVLGRGRLAHRLRLPARGPAGRASKRGRSRSTCPTPSATRCRTSTATLVAHLVRDIPGAVISVHCHNDLGLAVANSLAAVQAGARQVECTINGIGERAGNASLEEIVMALKVRGETLRRRRPACAPSCSRRTSAAAGRASPGVWPQPNKAVVGRNAFAHEAGIHQHGVLANPLCYEIMTPASVGVRRDRAGAGQALRAPRGAGAAARPGPRGRAPRRSTSSPRASRSWPTARSSSTTTTCSTLAGVAPERRARLVRYQVVSGNEVLPTATVEIEVDGERRSASAVGNGPLDAALKAADAALGLGARAAGAAHARGDRGQGRAGRGGRARAARGRPRPRARPPAPTPSRPRSRRTSRRSAPRGARRRRPREPRAAHAVREGLGRARRASGRPTRRPPCSTSTCTCVHEVTSPQAFPVLRERGLRVRRPDRTVATMDHSTPTAAAGRPDRATARRGPDRARWTKSCGRWGIPLFPLGDERQGIVHVIGPELGLTQPGHDHRLRRQPHQHPRRLRRPGLRHRHQRSRRTCWPRSACWPRSRARWP